jgi:hypothetical protein
MPKSERLKELEAEALELQRKIRAKYPIHVPEPWPEELQRWQGRLWQLGYMIVREQEKEKAGSDPGAPLTKEAIQNIATRTADEVVERLQGVPELGLHIAEHEATGSARVIDKAKAENPDIPCKCFGFEQEQYCWKPGYLGLISSKKNPEQMATCVVRVPASPGAQKRFAELKGALSEAHEEFEKEGGGLPAWWAKTGEALERHKIEL